MAAPKQRGGCVWVCPLLPAWEAGQQLKTTLKVEMSNELLRG